MPNRIHVVRDDEELEIIHSYNLGINNSYRAKPVDFERFIEVVRRLGYYWLLLNVPLRPTADDGGENQHA